MSDELMSYARRSCAKCGKRWSPASFYSTIQGCCKQCHNARVKRRNTLLRNDPGLKAREQELRRNRPAYYPPRDRAPTAWRVDQWRMKNRPKARALNVVAWAVRSYDLERKRCEMCGTAKNVCAFPIDLSQPLKVRWCCRKQRRQHRHHHRRQHHDHRRELAVVARRSHVDNNGCARIVCGDKQRTMGR
jgi:hypothetical protein